MKATNDPDLFFRSNMVELRKLICWITRIQNNDRLDDLSSEILKHMIEYGAFGSYDPSKGSYEVWIHTVVRRRLSQMNTIKSSLNEHASVLSENVTDTKDIPDAYIVKRAYEQFRATLSERELAVLDTRLNGLKGTAAAAQLGVSAVTERRIYKKLLEKFKKMVMS